ncbi:MAG: DUF1569 domain-containing protein [Bacteroidetes bacterium]|jgi:hypothetical protein|nr:DUF1569 domain-containing protein [Bacteroidota bacterium]
MVNQEKLSFIKKDAIQLLKSLKGNETPEWGKMNAQQMIEHLCDAIDDATGINNRKILTPADQLPGFRNFMMSEKEFKPNTKNILMSETPAPVKLAGLNEAIARLENSISRLELYFKDDEHKTIVNPFFGELNFEENIQLLHKHFSHHLRQFKLID